MKDTQYIDKLWNLVRFSNELKFCYGELLKEIYDETLQWAYEGDKMKMSGDIVYQEVHRKTEKGS